MQSCCKTPKLVIEEELYDKEFVDKWCYGFDELRERAQGYPPQKAAEITWVPEQQIREAARIYATSRPSGSLHPGHQDSGRRSLQSKL